MMAYRLRPSSNDILAVCEASTQFSERYPQPDTDSAREGTAAHHVWAHWHNHGGAPLVGSLAPNGVAVDAEMIVNARFMLDVIRKIGVPVYVEQTISTGAIHPEHGGTPDVAAFDPATYILDIADYKYGHGYVPVETWQLVGYSAEWIQHLVNTGYDEMKIMVRHTIVQPRDYDREGPIRQRVISAVELRADFNRLRSQAVGALSEHPKAVAGPQCEYCPGRHACGTLRRSDMAVLYLTEEMLVDDLPRDALGHELSMLKYRAKLLDARITGLEEEAQVRMRRGERIEGWGMEQKQGPLAWHEDVPIHEIAAIGKLMGVETTKQVPFTPTQLITAGVDASTIKAYSSRRPGAFKLTELDNKLTSKIFGD